MEAELSFLGTNGSLGLGEAIGVRLEAPPEVPHGGRMWTIPRGGRMYYFPFSRGSSHRSSMHFPTEGRMWKIDLNEVIHSLESYTVYDSNFQAQ